MKKLILFLSSIFIGLSILFSCNKNEYEIENIKPEKLVEQDISLVTGEKKTVKITDKGSYTVKSSNSKIKATTDKGIITIEGVASGDGVVLITESKRNVAKINVKVADATDLKLDKTNLILRKGTKGTILVKSGYGKYTLKVKDASIITAINTDKKIEITALKEGTTKVFVTDSKSNFTKEILVTVSMDKFIVDSAEVELKKDSKGFVNITSGSGEYKVKSNDNTIATVINTGTKIEITGVKFGTVKVIVTDKVYKLIKEITVKVLVDELKLNRKDLALKIGDKETVSITSGSGGYTVESKDISIASFTITGNEIEITALKNGTTKVIVTDKESKLSKEITVDISVQDLKLDKKNFTLQSGSTKTVNIIAGSGDYTVESNDTAIATVVKTGVKIEIIGISKGRTKVIVTDKVSKLTQEISVDVLSNGLVVNTEREEIKKGNKGTATITRGSGDYSVSSNDISIVTATLVNGNIIEFKGIKEGTTKVVVTDNISNQTKEISIEILDLEPIVLEYTKNAIGVRPFKIDEHGEYFNVNVGDKFTIAIDGGTGTNQYIKGGPEVLKYLAFPDTGKDDEGRDLVLQNSLVIIDIIDVPTFNSVHFAIKDTDGTVTKAIVFVVRAKGVNPPAPLKNYTVAPNGSLIGIKDEAIDVNGKLIIPASIKSIGYIGQEFQFKLTVEQRLKLKVVEIGMDPNGEDVQIGGYAFEQCTVLEKVILGPKVKALKTGFAFRGTALNELIIHNATPPDTTDGLIYIFAGVSGAVLKVPAGAVANYSAWSSKFTIEEM